MAEHTHQQSLNLNLRGMRVSSTLAINARSRELAAQGLKVYPLGLGQSPFPVPGHVVAALQANAHQKDYLPVSGLPALRAAVAAYHAAGAQIEIAAEDVLIGPGSKELMFLLQLAYYGDLVVPTPCWVSYAPQARMVGHPVQTLSTDFVHRWRLQPEALEALCKEDPDRPRLVILNYPGNPDGSTYRKHRLQELARVARRYNVILLSDEIYGPLQFDGQHVSVARYYPEGTIISGGLSKWCGAGGWRLGTFVFPKALRWLRDAMSAAASETYTSVSAPIQYAAVTAFSGGDAMASYLANARRILAALGHWGTGVLRQVGARMVEPQGAFYLFPDLSGRAEAFKRAGITTSRELAGRLLEETGVATLPGVDFGRPPEELTLRLAYVNFDGGAALAAVAKLAPEVDVDEAWLRRWCPETLAAFEVMADWLMTTASAVRDL
jgi:aspartate aminotransferase